MTISTAIYIFDDVEVLDFAGPYEVFTTASRVAQRSAPLGSAPFSVCTVACSPMVRARAGLVVKSDFDFSNAPPIDLLIIAGGVVTNELLLKDVIEWITSTSIKAKLTASVCTGAFLLAQAGLLDGKCATTHWEDIDELRSMFPKIDVRGDCRWVEAPGPVITSAGISAGIDMSLNVVEFFAGRELALATAKQMDYVWG